MAQSRLEKVGTIYTRVCSLLKTGAMKEENKPVWLDIYRAFPPKYEPTFGRETPQVTVQPIFYAEDKIRARFHRDHKNYSMVNLLDNQGISKTEYFLRVYKQLEREGIPEEQLYDKAVEAFLLQYKHEKSQKETEESKPSVARTRRTPTESASSYAEAVDYDTDKVQYKPIKLRLDKIMAEGEESVDDENKHKPMKPKSDEVQTIGEEDTTKKSS